MHNQYLNIIKYIRILYTTLKISLIRDLEFRSNLVFGILVTLVWQVYTFVIAFSFIGRFQQIGDWGPIDLLILVTTWRMLNGFVHFLFYFSLNRLPRKISSGNLDYILCKPLNKLILSCLEYFGFNNFLDGVINFAIILFLLQTINLYSLSIFLILSLLGILLQFFIWLFIVTLTFHTGSLHGTFDLFGTLRADAKVPIDAYRGISPLLFSFILPFVLLTTVPASLLTGNVNEVHVLMYIGIILLITFTSLIFWKFSLKRYTSASS